MTRGIAAFALLLSFLSVELVSCPYAPGPSNPSEDAVVRLKAVVQGLDRPLFVTVPPGDRERLFIVEQGGRILLQKNGVLLDTPFLDISSLISSGGERGLLGMAFHPDYGSNGIFLVNYTNIDGDTVLASYYAYADDPDRGDSETAVILLTIAQPFSNHNGGMIAFGPDGYLYVASGDGGSGNDPDDNGQSLNTLLGKILRIDVNSGSPYGIPPSNPFVGTAGIREEIWAYGLRNPWRFSFDRATGDLWIADVGENAMEEINLQYADSAGGENYGWRNREGTLCRPGENECDRPNLTGPLHVYFNVGGQAITGGYVYRGTAIPQWVGTYFFADFVTGKVYTLTQDDDGLVTVSDETDRLNSDGVTLSHIASFGEDDAGELYIVDYGTGAVYQVVAS